jgi:anti-sigma factor RsiW
MTYEAGEHRDGACQEWRKQLIAYADESLAPEETASVEQHLRTCKDCAAETLALIQMKRATRAAAAARFAPSAEFRARMEKQVLKTAKPRWRIAWTPALVVTLALALMAISTYGVMRSTERERTVAELLDLHVATMASANPVDVISTDKHTVKPWFQGKLPFTFNLPELGGSAYKLLGGKVVYFRNAPGAQLLYELGKHDISVFIVQDDASVVATNGVTTRSEQGFSVESWREGGLRYTAMSDAGAPDVHALGEMFRNTGR